MNKIFNVVKADYYISKNVYSKPKTPLRTVQTHELELYTTDGNISVINGVQYKQRAGNLLSAKPGDLRYSIGCFESYYIHFSCFDKDIADILNNMTGVFPLSDAEDIKRIFKDFIKAQLMPKISQELLVQGKLLELIGILTAENEKKYCGKYEHYLPAVFSACEFMEKNYDQRLTLEAIAASVSLSPGFFHTVFKTIKGTTPAEYLLALRLGHAKNILKKSNLPISEIAFSCGFGSQSYFSYAFKRHTSLTPKAYRDKKQIII